ncbi:hypothetical protein [Pedobacter metabolipauper]|uniref:Outer membrane protein with beta-barrel domain n=1 Tax=Pedobacter metabolipauper TaxID=425513 RepID=A0A4R6ST91_9SPHI|nr:hypothetical protein [Pedobacter metabolipauper]TDQ08557.1 hypothetical protein ATK78_3073 [Pedobacter metabolipauper]
MRNLSFVTILLFFLSVSAVNAQTGPVTNGPRLGIGADFAFPQNNSKNNPNYGAGASLLYQHPLAKALNLTVNVGYLRFNGDPVFANIKYRQGFVPIKAGLRLYVTGKFFAAGELGASISTANGNGKGTGFAYAPNLGFEFPVSNSGSIDLSARYENWSGNNNMSFIGLRAGFNF